MTKRFCDLCGKPAHDRAPGGTFNSGQPWRGYRAADGGCDGTWQPKLQVSVGIHMKDFKDKAGIPDLCADCMVDLLKELIVSIQPGRPAEQDNLAKVDAVLESERRLEILRQSGAGIAGAPVK